MIHGEGWSPDENRLERAAHKAAARRARSAGARIKRVSIIVTVYIVGASFVSIDPGRWFHPDTACGPQTSAAVVTEPATVKIARDQGALLRKLTGEPPDPARTIAAAQRAADAVVASTLAFRASLQGKDDPAAVSAYNTAYRARKASEQAQDVASSCAPVCPPGQEPQETLTVAAAGGFKADAEQQENAAAVMSVGRARGIPQRGQVVALAAALQESGLRNLDHGDRDSVGIFQQRASWGSVATRMDVTASAARFYDALERVPHWQGMSVTAAAQAVQVSAHPDAYAKWEGDATSLLGSGSIVSAASACATAPAPSTYKTGAGVAWGGYTNGRIPTTALAHPRSAPRELLRPDAAAALDRLSAAYQARFGKPLGVTDSYRDYAGQVSVYARKPGLAAEPGTSNHGLGLAIDGVVGGYTSTDYLWLRANAPAFGWDNPGWARPGGSSKHEPWHWEFNPIGATT